MRDGSPPREVGPALGPLDATFRDSLRAPLHGWFPYLEGYSPRFVRRVYEHYLPGATRILEPFCGSGTTPIVLGQLGVSTGWCEANPVMRAVIGAKLDVVRLAPDTRGALALRLVDLAGELGPRAAAAGASTDLADSYPRCFGRSEFFRAEALRAVLRLRSLVDGVRSTDRLLADLLEVAVMGRLVASSLLRRAGDVRFRTETELARGVPELIPGVAAQLRAIAQDIDGFGAWNGAASLVCPDAKSLGTAETEPFDGVITSPPYLNGTNYIRNTKLELWFRRDIVNRAGLRLLRDSVVTSGINDVDGATPTLAPTPGVERLIREMASDAYDVRIPKMVAGYFHDMAKVMVGIAALVKSGGRICVDIGDSVYGNVHVPTDDLLVELGQRLSLELVERVNLRTRRSKGGTTLRQQLLVFRRSAAPSWEPGWATFKRELPHQVAPYSSRSWGSGWHSMCSYQGKMKPSLAHHLVLQFSCPGDVVADPFSGAGTIPFEACLNGRVGVGLDVSELGYVLTAAKLAHPDLDAISGVLDDLQATIETGTVSEAELEDAGRVSFNGPIPSYFHEATLREILLARRHLRAVWDSGPAWALVYSCLMHILHGNRPYALSRRSHPITPFKPTGDFEYRGLMGRLREKVRRVVDEPLPPTFRPGLAVFENSITGWPASLPLANAIITSPPFFDSTRFYMTNWMRYWMAGWSRSDFDSRTAAFLETRQKRSLDVYIDVFRAFRARIQPNGVLVMHLGMSPKCDMAAELARRAEPSFRLVDSFTEGVAHCESHGVRDKGTVSGHSYLVLAPR